MDGRLVTYFCPSHYCQCVPNGDMPGCIFNPDRVDDQCAHNRTGVLCGKCKKDLSVGLRSVKHCDFRDGAHKLAFQGQEMTTESAAFPTVSPFERI